MASGADHGKLGKRLGVTTCADQWAGRRLREWAVSPDFVVLGQRAALDLGGPAIDTTVPTSRELAKASMLTVRPKLVSSSRKIEVTEPSRLIAVAKPTPEERSLARNDSAGNTPMKLLTADRTRVNPAKHVTASRLATKAIRRVE